VKDLSAKEAHPRYLITTAKSSIALAKITWELQGNLTVADSLLVEVISACTARAAPVGGSKEGGGRGGQDHEMGWGKSDIDLRDLVYSLSLSLSLSHALTLSLSLCLSLLSLSHTHTHTHSHTHRHWM